MKVLIIDDEPNVRAGIKMLIPWQVYQFEICGEGIDGVEGLEKIKQLNPDLVLIDIRMPGLSGIEVIEQARRCGFCGKFIITTGYSDFEYAQKAIHLGVSTYLLKPIDEDELALAVQKLKNQILEEVERQEKLNLSDTYIEKSLMNNLLLGKEIDCVELRHYEYLKKRQVSYHIALVGIEEGENRQDAIVDIVQQYFTSKENTFYIIVLQKQIVIVLEEIKNSILLIEKMQEKIQNRCKVEVKIAISSNIENLSKLHEAYVEANELLEKKFLFPKYKVLALDRIQKEKKALRKECYASAEWLGKKLFNLLQVGDKVKIREELCNLRSFLQQEDAHSKKISSLCSNALLKTVQLLADTYSEFAEVMPEGEVIIEHIYQCKDIDEIIGYIEDELFAILHVFNVNTPENTMQKLIYYIGNNYGSDLKLEYLAELFNYNSAYLGKSFKNHTGKSFNAYLDGLRINKAKELLLVGEMKVYEIAKLVGYKHIDYFHSKFKRYVGVSPLEYKKKADLVEISDKT